MIQYIDGIQFNPERNEKRVKHFKCLHAFPEKLKLIQVCHILGLNVLVFVGELPSRVLFTKMLRRAKKLWNGSWCGARLGGSKSNAVNLILRLFLYHFLHTMSS
jgi:hypothetical protein